MRSCLPLIRRMKEGRRNSKDEFFVLGICSDQEKLGICTPSDFLVIYRACCTTA